MPTESPRDQAAPMRVAYVTMLFPAASETFACLDVHELGRKGFEVAVHSLRPRATNVDQLARDRGVETVDRTYNDWRATTRGLRTMVTRPRLSAGFLKRLVRLTVNRPRELAKSLVLLPRVFDVFERLRLDPPDVVHVYWGHYPALVGALVQERLPETVVSMSLGAYDLVADYPPTATVAQRAAFVRTHTRANVQALVERVGINEGRIAVVYNGIDMALAPATPESVVRIPGRMVTAGRLTKTKAMDDVLRAFERVWTQHPHATLEVFGNGAERGHLESLAASLSMSEAVTFRGHQNQRELFAALSRAEFFLFMSRDITERLPNVIKEAMACGAVCISADSIGLDELIPSANHGVVVAPGAFGAAADAALALLQDPDRMAAIRVHARRHIVEYFDVRRTTEAYVERWRVASETRMAR